MSKTKFAAPLALPLSALVPASLSVMVAVLVAGLVSALALSGCHAGAPPEQGGGKPPPQTFCGGIGAVQCPTGYDCEDDPSDQCDPSTGGADCGGICVSQEQACGKGLCGPGQYCCNQSCGLCAPIGGACIQKVCE